MTQVLLNPKTIIYIIGAAAFGYFLSLALFPSYQLTATIIGGLIGLIASFFY